jgi:hypothetical protein
MSWRTIKKYLDAPAQTPAQRQRESKLDCFKTTIAEWLEKDPSVTTAVIEQKLRTLGYRGGHTILRDYVHTARPQLKPNRAFLRMEPPPGERFEVDWGHFGTLDYQGDKRKLYAFALGCGSFSDGVGHRLGSILADRLQQLGELPRQGAVGVGEIAQISLQHGLGAKAFEN